MSAPRWRLPKKAFALVGLGVATALLFTGARARRLLANSRQIAAQSALFSRNYYLGSGPPLTYLVMGDSTAAGWGAGTLEATYPHHIATALAARHFRVHVVNVAVGGATLEEVRRDQSAALETVKPDVVTLSVGANDATHRTSEVSFKRDWLWLEAALAKSSARAILVANVPDMFLAPALPYPLAIACGRRARALNAVLQSLPPNPKWEVVDLFAEGKLDSHLDAGLYAADSFHPSGRGYAIWAEIFIKKLKLVAPVSASGESRRR